MSWSFNIAAAKSACINCNRQNEQCSRHNNAKENIVNKVRGDDCKCRCTSPQLGSISWPIKASFTVIACLMAFFLRFRLIGYFHGKLVTLGFSFICHSYNETEELLDEKKLVVFLLLNLNSLSSLLSK